MISDDYSAPAATRTCDFAHAVAHHVLLLLLLLLLVLLLLLLLLLLVLLLLLLVLLVLPPSMSRVDRTCSECLCASGLSSHIRIAYHTPSC